MKGKVLFIDTVHPVLRDELESDGWKCDWHVDHSLDQIKAEIGHYDGVVIRSKFTMNKELIDLSTNLKFIARSGSGLENIDVEYAKSKGIHIFNSPEGNRDAVGEQALGMLLALFQKLLLADAEVRSGQWNREKNRGIELKGKTVGIIGFGQMGTAFAQRLKGFECKVLAYDKYKPSQKYSGVKMVDLATLQQQADIISFHVPLTEETTYFFNEEFLANCSKPIYVVNMSRGKVVNTQDLVRGLESGKLLGACLDVLEYESSSFENDLSEKPAAMAYLFQSDKVLLSPHVAGWTKESYVKLSLVLLEKIRKVFP